MGTLVDFQAYKTAVENKRKNDEKIQELQAKILKINQESASEVSKLQMPHANQSEALRKRHERELHTLGEKHKRETANLEREHARKESVINERATEMRRALESEIRTLESRRTSLDIAIKNASDSYAREQRKLEEEMKQKAANDNRHRRDLAA